MSVIGIDFGNQNCYVAVARAGGIETIANDYSLRATPSCVAFTDRNRILGVAAANQVVTNSKNTVFEFKRLLGRKSNECCTNTQRLYVPYDLVPNPDGSGSVAIKVKYLKEEHVFTPEQITAMLFTKLKDTVEATIKTKANDCVISVPSYFTQAERKALLDAAHIAGLNVLRLFNETTATALAYGIYKQDLPNDDEKPRNVVFVDCGHSSTQVCVAAFNKGKLKILASNATSVGGRDFDRVLTHYFAKQFNKMHRIDPTHNRRALLRLMAEVEKLKKQMSANSTSLPLNIECLIDEKDFHSSLKRCDMEELCKDLFEKIENALNKCRQDSKLSFDDFYAVEIVGGSTRIPAIKESIERVFRKPVSTTLNQDEAVARGCALQCAALSPAIRVREFGVTDTQQYEIILKWDAVPGEGKGEMKIFEANSPVPYSKLLTFYRREPFSVQAVYNFPDGPMYYPESDIGKFTIKDVRPTQDNETGAVKVKVRINLHGILTVAGATLTEKLTPAEIEAEAKESMDVDTNNQEQKEKNAAMENGGEEVKDQGNEDDMDQQHSQQQEKDMQEGEKKEKKKKVLVKKIDLNIEEETYGLSKLQLDSFYEFEGKMIANDRQEKERADARNALEEYVYELRNKLGDDYQLAPFVNDADREDLNVQLNYLENWLYDEGENCNRQIYTDKLDQLKKHGEPIKNRKVEADIRPTVIEDFARSIQQSYKIIEQFKNNNERYNHIPEADINKAEQETQRVEKWLEEKRMKIQSTPKYENPPVTVAEIRQEKQNFDNLVAPIFNKPKPKPKTETPPPQQPPEENNKATGDSVEPNNFDEKMETD